MRNLVLFLSCVLFLLVCVSCGKKNPLPGTKWYGSNSIADGYGQIVKNSNDKWNQVYEFLSEDRFKRYFICLATNDDSNKYKSKEFRYEFKGDSILLFTGDEDQAPEVLYFRTDSQLSTRKVGKDTRLTMYYYKEEPRWW